MRIGLDVDTYTPANDNVIRTTNYSKAEINKGINLDITNHGKDANFVLDQGRSIKEVMDEAGALDVQTTQDMMTVMSNTMSGEDYNKMCEEGYNPSDMEPGETVTIVDHIKAVMAESGTVIAGYNDGMDSAKLEEITGSVADANKLALAMKEADIPVNKDTAKAIWDAANELASVDALSDSCVKFMLDRQLDPTIENIYTARHSSVEGKSEQVNGYYSVGMHGYLARKADYTESDNLDAQIEKTINNLGIDGIDKDKQINDAKWLLENGEDITKANLIRYDRLTSLSFPILMDDAIKIAANSVGNGKTAKSGVCDYKGENIYIQAASIMKQTEEIKDEDIAQVCKEGKDLNLNNLWNCEGTLIDNPQDEAYVTAKRYLEEVRLRMTLDVNVRMLKLGIDVDTISLSDLVENLKSEEANLRTSIFGQGSEEELNVKASVFKNTRNALEEIPYLPAATAGRLRLQESSLRTVVEYGTELRTKYEAANESYEELMTKPRSDMGDNINKAFRNVDDILESMGLERTDDNRKAVRILGYNSMPINEYEIDRIKEVCSKLENVVKDMTPQKTLELIRQGINPMNMPIEDLDKTLKEMKLKEDSAEKYSKFLYKLEKSEAISASEREAFIGIYRFVNRLEKTDYASVGALVNGQNNITFANLLSGIRSKKAKFNVSIDDNFGMLTDTVKKGVSITEQIEQAFAQKVGAGEEQNLERQYREEQAENFRNNIAANNEMADSLTEADVEVTVNNLVGASLLKSKEENVFNKAFEYEKRLEDKEKSVLELIDKFEENFNDEKSAKEGYATILDNVKETVSDMAEYVADTSIDLKTLSLCNKQISVAAKMSMSENYVVPYMTENGPETMNLTIRHDTDNAGTVTATLNSEKFGEMTAFFKMDENGLSGIISTQNKEGLDVVKQIAKDMNEKYGEKSSVSAVIGIQNLNNESRKGKISKESADINIVDTKELYNVAKTFLIAFKKA